VVQARAASGEVAFTHPSGRTIYQADTPTVGQWFSVEGTTPAEAWHRAVEAAQACVMLID
jgi:hypothetical protein